MFSCSLGCALINISHLSLYRHGDQSRHACHGTFTYDNLPLLTFRNSQVHKLFGQWKGDIKKFSRSIFHTENEDILHVHPDVTAHIDKNDPKYKELVVFAKGQYRSKIAKEQIDGSLFVQDVSVSWLGSSFS